MLYLAYGAEVDLPVYYYDALGTFPLLEALCSHLAAFLILTEFHITYNCVLLGYPFLEAYNAISIDVDILR